jgi:DNA-binding CsgD family transcriptional regulator
MLDLCPAAAKGRPATGAPTVTNLAYPGPERRQAGGWHRLMLDEIDYGMLLVDAGAQLLHINHAARQALDEQHPLQLLGRELRARRSLDVLPLRDALLGAALRGLRRLLVLGDTEHRVAIAVVPLMLPGRSAPRATQLTFGKRQLAGELSTQCFARSLGLTQAETRVLEALCEGLQPLQIAARHGVGIATVRTQICSIRAKSRAENIGALVRQVATLPPLLCTLRAAAEPAAWARAA